MIPQSMYRRRAVALLCPAFLLTACGGSSDVDPARFRVLHVSPGYETLNVYLDGDVTLQNVAYGTVSGYAEFDEDEYEVEFRRSGVAGALQRVTRSFRSETYGTYVAYGALGSFSTLYIEEDVEDDEVDPGEAGVSIVHAAPEAGSLDVYLTDASSSLNDVTPLLSGVDPGSASELQIIDSGSYRLRITAQGSKTDVRLDVSGVSFADDSIGSLVIGATGGGVLVNALQLPQQGALTVRNNTNARVRGAVGLQGAQAASIQVGGVTLLGAVPPATVGNYRLIEAGSRDVTLTVDGAGVGVPAQTLTAGQDYTLLVWTEAGATRATLLEDDNRRPSSGSAKVRLVHSMSGLADPISLAVDFSPSSEGVARGTASEPDEIVATTDSRLDVTNANTGERLFFQTGTTLQDQGVYSVFVFGSAASATGLLRKDR